MQTHTFEADIAHFADFKLSYDNCCLHTGPKFWNTLNDDIVSPANLMHFIYIY